MKHAWILNHYAKDPSDPGGTRHFHLVEKLRDFGWSASIIASSVDHVSGHQRLPSNVAYRLDILHGVPFLWINTPVYRGNGASRIGNMLAYSFAVLRRRTTAELPRPDVIIGSSVHPFAALAGALLARRYKVPFVFEVRDLWPQTLVDMGRLRDDALVTFILRKLEKWLYHRAARTIVVLPLAWQYIVPLGVRKEHVVWIPNGVDPSLFVDFDLPRPQSEDFFTLMYFGAHGQANCLDTLLDAMALVQSNPAGKFIRLRLVGDGALKPILLAQADALGLRNVVFEPPVPKSCIPKLAAQADAFVINVLNLPGLYKYGISMNKIFDYLAAGKPILIASDAANNPVKEAQAGLTIPPGDPKEFANAILQIANTPLDERKRMGYAGRMYVEQNHGFDHLAKRLAITLDAVCAEAV